ncbi:MAG: SDR family oxidoreductase [Armatimonadetes bacterium]|nr:SDR family oxidoreductase [Armatimonadota bacterium]
MSELAVVTGAASGIGRATCERFLREGWRVVGLDRDPVDVPGASTVVCDLADVETLPALVAEMVADHGSPAALVNNAGTWCYEPFTDIATERWERIFRVNVTAPFILCRELAPGMVAAGRGWIVNISSRNAMVSSRGSTAYDASKAAVLAMTRCLAGELAPHGVMVNAICPGVVDTPANAELLADEDASAAYLRLIPQRRFGSAEEIAGLVWFLTTPDAGFVCGQAIVADGGQMAFADWKHWLGRE